MAAGPWITFSEYPQEAFDRLFGNFKNVGFAYTSTEKELKEAVRKCVKSRYPDWMLESEFEDESGVEPDSIECFKKFHVKRNGDWASDHA
ncbi:hypothetical protein WN943_006740 [Citrus x changshan-huyou]